MNLITYLGRACCIAIALIALVTIAVAPEDPPTWFVLSIGGMSATAAWSER